MKATSTACATSLIAASLLLMAANGVRAAQYEWTFSQGDLSPALGNGIMSYADGVITAALTTFGTTDGSTVPHIGGQPATYMHVLQLAGLGNGYHLKFNDSGANGGGGYINQYTVMYDVYLPGAAGWTALFNADPENTSGNDGDFYIAPDGGIGIGAGGYSAAGTIAPNTWYRIGFAVDLAAGASSTYVNGSLVKQNSGGLYALDGRFSLYSNADTLPSLLLFNEGDPSGIYTHELYVSSVYFTDQTLNPSQMAALGGPNAAGIAPVPEPGTWALLGMGALAFAFWRRQWKK